MALTTDTAQAGLAKERARINALDAQIARLLKERFVASAHIAELKQEASVPVLNSAREQQVLDQAEAQIGDAQLAIHARNIFTAIMKESRDFQQQLNAKKAQV